MKSAKRCNRAAYVYAAANGFRLCRECYFASINLWRHEWRLCSEDGPPSSYGRCDRAMAPGEQHGRPA